MTFEDLKEAIREAETIEELKRIVGPSVEDEDAARNRLRLMDTIWNKYRSFDAMPPHTLSRYNRLQDKQNAFENLYC